MHPDITLEDTQLPLERNPKILGAIMDPSLSFHKHCTYVSDRMNKRNNLLKALAGSSWGHEKETLLLTYNALGNLSQAMQHQSGAPTQMTQEEDTDSVEYGFEDGDRGPQDEHY